MKSIFKKDKKKAEIEDVKYEEFEEIYADGAGPNRSTQRSR